MVKGVVLGINPAARLVDLTHGVPPQDVRWGALALASAYRFFPRGTVHLAVVDPGVGGARRPLAVYADGHYFIGPDNGLLSVALDCPGAIAVAVTQAAYHRPAVSWTFHARDVFAPVAAHCSRGVPIGRFGPPVTDPVRIAWPRIRRRGRRVVGEVLLADHFGNLLTSISVRDLPAASRRCRVEVGRQAVEGLVRTYGERPPGSLGALIDSSGRLEIFVRDGSAQDRLGIGPGAAVSLQPGSTASPRRTRSRSRARRGPRPSSRPPGPRSPRLRQRASSRPPSPSSGTPTGSRSRTSRSPSG
jgi:S-adenosylmethionine hydrolase